MAETRILMVVNDAEASSAYAKALSGIGVTYDVAPSIRKMAGMATDSAYKGLIIDILTLVRCSREEKAIAYDCINIFPVLRVKWDKKLKQINISPVEQTNSSDAGCVLKQFVEKCEAMPPKQLRRYKRSQMNLHLLLSRDETFPSDNTYRAFSVTMSLGGLFIHTMEDFHEGERLWLQFPEFTDRTPIPVEVVWMREWGSSRTIPGIGVKFAALTEAQERDLERVLKL